jgi:hypothetical protein
MINDKSDELTESLEAISVLSFFNDLLEPFAPLLLLNLIGVSANLVQVPLDLFFAHAQLERTS